MVKLKQLGDLGKGAERSWKFAPKTPISDTLKRPQPIIVTNVELFTIKAWVLCQTYCYIFLSR